MKGSWVEKSSLGRVKSMTRSRHRTEAVMYGTGTSLVVCVQVGKEFPDMRQNDRRKEFIRVGDTVRTVGQLQGELIPLAA